MGEIKELSPEEFRQMQLLQLDMLVELDRVCRENNINYTILVEHFWELSDIRIYSVG